MLNLKNEKFVDLVREWMPSCHSGRQLSLRLSQVVDDTLREVFLAHVDNAPLALIATGGYGRNELAPYSDIDIMFYAKDRTASNAAERVLYELWDRNLDISHSFRTAPECIDEAFRDVRTRTSLLEARFIAGSQRLYQEFREQVYPVIAYRRQKEFIGEKLRELERRRQSSGASVYLLEPHVKEGEGGLRDIHTVLWLSRIALRAERFEDLEAVLGGYEFRRLSAAYDFLVRTRYCLHLASCRRNDILGFEYQKTISQCLGFNDSKKFSGAERMMRYYYLKSRIVREAAGRVTALCGKRYTPVARDLSVRKTISGYLLSAGRIIASRPEHMPDTAERILEMYAASAQSGKPISPQARDTIRSNLVKINQRSRNAPRAVQAFLKILASDCVHQTLSEMHESGVLGRFLPEFGALRALVVHEPYHLYTVDEHTLVAIRNLEQLRTTKYERLGELRALVNQAKDRDMLYLALLLHDIGKAVGRHHGEEGYKRLKNILERFRMDSGKRLRIEFLVRNHILMSAVALRRELSDPSVIARFAEEVEDRDNLQALYLMTYADMSAVNPSFWTAWKAVLLRELYLRTQEHLDGIPRSEGEQIRRLRSLARGLDEGEFSGFVKGMPGRYFRATPEDEIIRDYRLVSDGMKAGCAVRIDVGADQTAVISISAPDAPGLFSRIVGFLSLRGMNIVSGRVFTATTGVALDKITVSNWKAVWWEGLESDIAAGLPQAIFSRVDHEVPARRPGGKGLFEAFLELDNESSESDTLVEIFCPDRIGLLYEISQVMYRLKVDIYSAKITTEAGLAQDVFMVRRGKKKVSGHEAQELIGALWEILET